MRVRLAVAIVILICGVSGLTTHARRYRSKDARSKYIDSMLAFRPLVQIRLIRDGDEMQYSDSFSRVSRAMHEQLLEQYSQKMKISELCRIESEALQAAIDAEVSHLFVQAAGRRFLEDGLGCPKIDSIASAKGQRFVLLMLNNGFLRTKANFRAEERKGIAPAIVSLGMVNKVTIAVNSNMRAMILDLRNWQTYYYNDAFGNETTSQQSPVNAEALEKQLRALFTTFFWSAPM